tara:strand:- start:193 stop:1392 length:1200 start_codon:yes stop_codon:yes gene_type:complete
MRESNKIFFGDRVLWVLLGLIALFSFLPIYSSSSNLVHVIGNGTSSGYLLKHLFIIGMGFVLMFFTHKIPYKYFKGISILLIPLSIILLIYTATQSNIIDGSNANRWLRIPIIGVSFQTSTFSSLVLMVYVANYLSKSKNHKLVFDIIPFWLPIYVIVMLILPSNFSSAFLLFFMVLTSCLISGYKLKNLFIIILFSFLSFAIFIGVIKIYPDIMPNRVDTWQSRIESFINKNQTKQESYQIERSKIAIASGEFLGLGAGKSVMKNFLPQSSSDFIYAIIIEEYGSMGGIILIILYLLILFRILVISHRAQSLFGKLLTICVGLPIIFQSFLNIGVALQVFPITGQTLPMISSGGTSVWITCLSFGIILSVSSFYTNLFPENELEVKNDNPLKILSETV